MVEFESFLVALLLWTGDGKIFRHNRHQIMTPNNGQSGSTPLSQGNIDEIALFSPQSSNNIVPDSTDSATTCVNKVQTQATPSIPTSIDSISVETATTPAVLETVTTIGGTVIKIEMPSSINIFVNITNSGQPVVDIPPIVTNVEISTADTTVGTPADTSTVEASTVSSTVEISTTVSNVDTSVGSTSQTPSLVTTETSLSTDNISLTSTVSSTVEISTTVSNVDTSVGSTSQIPSSVTTETSQSTDNISLTSTVSSTVELSTTVSNVDTSVGSTSQTPSSVTTETSQITDNIPLTSTVSSIVEISTTVSNVDTSVGSTSQTPSSVTTETSLSTDNIPLTSTVSSTVEISTTVSNVDTTSQIPSSVLTETSLNTDNILLTSTVVSTVEIPTEESNDEASSTVGDTVEEIPDGILTPSTVKISTEDSTVEMSTVGSTTEVSVSTVDNTVVVLTAEGVEPSTTEPSTVENVTETSTITENNSIAAPTINESSTEAMRYIQININLSDNNHNGDFGFTTQSSTSNLGQLQNKMIYKQKCDEYYANSRVGREAKVTVFIVGGTSSIPKEFPHMAALGYGNDFKREWLCGGSLISENYVITAAHCVSPRTYGNVQVVRLGTTRLDTETLNSHDYNVIRRTSHPGYSTDEQYDDIALLQLDRPVTFSEYVSPICLYSSNVTDEVLIASGWGKTEATGDVSPELQKVELEYFPNIECQNSYSGVSKEDLPRGIVAESQICAGSRTEEKDTCQGDSGGPLQIKENGRMYLVGITSFGIACGQPGRPGVYTRVSHYIPWIENIVWGNAR